MEDNMSTERFMASLAGALVAGGALLFLIPSASAASAGAGAIGGVPAAAGVKVERVQNGSCAELRRACLYKRELGERGQGNCSRYRAACTTGSGAGDTSYTRYREYRAYRPYYRAYRPWRYYD
jgi:hypothetical protein